MNLKLGLLRNPNNQWNCLTVVHTRFGPLPHPKRQFEPSERSRKLRPTRRVRVSSRAPIKLSTSPLRINPPSSANRMPLSL